MREKEIQIKTFLYWALLWVKASSCAWNVPEAGREVVKDADQSSIMTVKYHSLYIFEKEDGRMIHTGEYRTDGREV